MTGQVTRRQHPPLSPRRERDPGQRDRATRLGEAFPHWLIHWGAWSQRYWAYPRFRAPRGTILNAADPGDLAAQMRQVQAAVTGQGRQTAMTATRPVPAPDAETVTSRILPAGTTPAGPGLTPPGQTDEQTDGQAHLDLPTVVTAPCDARHFTMARMKAWGLPPDAILQAKTVVTELVTNAYQAAQSTGAAGCISMTLRRLPGQVVIEVSDNSPGLPVKSYATDDAESGRGLHIIEAMSQEWGCQPRHCGGKVVYAIMRVPP